ncbi:hypothetical protein PRIPAC_98121 [Pristionchus pacificus]|uniref:Uncharacterized protein n=1 Tax=Pristionchus pacificus TaxID=54126 RepID=A0A2A6BZ44_PRIPA|nr:hypothetical protein PRIPAC_98121 [Pristionchus pacificus]|eukprot:PDM71116.1 hypothetical protein PRIPAC_38503 [Pristionchus pacificus]
MQLLLFLFTLYSVLGCRFAVRSGEKIKPPDQGKRKIEDQSKTSKTNQEIKPPDLRKRGETEVTNKAKIREIYAAVCLRIGQIRMGLAQLKNSDFLKPCVSGFSRVLMTIDIFIFNVDLQLVPDDVTSKTVFLVLLRRAKLSEFGSWANDASVAKKSMPIVISILENPNNTD